MQFSQHDQARSIRVWAARMSVPSIVSKSGSEASTAEASGGLATKEQLSCIFWENHQVKFHDGLAMCDSTFYWMKYTSWCLRVGPSGTWQVAQSPHPWTLPEQSWNLIIHPSPWLNVRDCRGPFGIFTWIKSESFTGKGVDFSLMRSSAGISWHIIHHMLYTQCNSSRSMRHCATLQLDLLRLNFISRSSKVSWDLGCR